MKYRIIRASTMAATTIELNSLDELLRLVALEGCIILSKDSDSEEVTLWIGDEAE